MQRERYVVPNTYDEESLIAVPLMMGEIAALPRFTGITSHSGFSGCSF